MAYDTGWVPIVDLETGSSVANKFDVAFGNTDSALNDIDTRISTLDTRVSTNETNISTNATNITDLDTRVTAIENKPLGTYEFSTLASPLVLTTDVFTEVVRVTIASLPNGIYEYKLGAKFSYDTTGSSAIFRYAIIRNDDVSPVWHEIWLEPKDVTNEEVFSIFYPIDEQNGDKVDLVLGARCESATHTLTINYADVIIDQKR